MSLLKVIDTHPNTEPLESRPAADRLVSGDPSFRTWVQDLSREGSVKTALWEATPGEHHSIKGTMFEFCHILSGVVEISEEGGGTATYSAGDSIVMKPGFVGIWRTIETVRKIYVTVS